MCQLEASEIMCSWLRLFVIIIVGSPQFSCKLDILKAFDSLNWSFIFNVLAAMNFPVKFMDWIKLCVTSCKHSVKFNAALEGFFHAAT